MVEIEYIPLKGHAETIKTRKQGRDEPLGQVLNTCPPSYQRYGRFDKLPDSNMTNVLAHRILRFEKSTPAQKKFAQNHIDIIKIGDESNAAIVFRKKISDINKHLFRTHKEYRKI